MRETRLTRGLFCVAVLALVGCDALVPSPSQPPPTALPLDDPQLVVIADQALPCEERLEAMAELLPCDRYHTAEGYEARCELEPPFETLMFGCGPEPEQRPRERLRLTPAAGTMPEIFAARAMRALGPCEVEAVGPIGDVPPRWHDDDGDVACFFARDASDSGLGSGFRTFEGGTTPFAAGVFLELDEESTSESGLRELLDGPVEERELGAARALVVETELLSEAERAASVRFLTQVLEI